jgi:hypothetical protein
MRTDRQQHRQRNEKTFHEGSLLLDSSEWAALPAAKTTSLPAHNAP